MSAQNIGQAEGISKPFCRHVSHRPPKPGCDWGYLQLHIRYLRLSRQPARRRKHRIKLLGKLRAGDQLSFMRGMDIVFIHKIARHDGRAATLQQILWHALVFVAPDPKRRLKGLNRGQTRV